MQIFVFQDLTSSCSFVRVRSSAFRISCVPFKKRPSIYIKVTNDYHVANTVPRGRTIIFPLIKSGKQQPEEVQLTVACAD